jgi:hypothetical protein
VRHEPQTTGGSHNPDYVGDAKFPTILIPDIGCSYRVAVPGQATPLVRTVEYAPIYSAFAPVSAPGAGTRRVGFFLQDDLHAQTLGFVGEFVSDAAMRPLMNLLVIFASNIGLLSDIAHIANDQRLHACLMQRGDEDGGLLMLDLLDLVFNLGELSFLGTDDALAALAAFLHLAINAAVQFRLQFVAVLDLGTQQSPVEDLGLGSIVGDRHMDFP